MLFLGGVISGSQLIKLILQLILFHLMLLYVLLQIKQVGFQYFDALLRNGRGLLLMYVDIHLHLSHCLL